MRNTVQRNTSRPSVIQTDVDKPKAAIRFGVSAPEFDNALVASIREQISSEAASSLLMHDPHSSTGEPCCDCTSAPFDPRSSYTGCVPGRIPVPYSAINFQEKFSLFTEQWQPKVIAEMNDYQFKIAKLQGDFVWHNHKDTDETFIVIEGNLRIDFRDGAVHIGPGEMFVVPKGIEHKPFAELEVKLLLIEPRGVKNTGESAGDRTAPNDIWI